MRNVRYPVHQMISLTHCFSSFPFSSMPSSPYFSFNMLITTFLWLPLLFLSSFLSFTLYHLSSPAPLYTSVTRLTKLYDCYFLLICKPPLLPISTSERLLLMVPKVGNQPWIHTRTFAGIVQVCHIMPSHPLLTKVQLQYNIYEWKWSQFI